MSYYPPQQNYGGPPQGPPPPQGYGQQPQYGGYGAPRQGQYPPQQGYPPNPSYPPQPGYQQPPPGNPGHYHQQQGYPPPNQPPYQQQQQGYPPPNQPPYQQQSYPPQNYPPQGQYGPPQGQGQYPPPQGQGQYPPPQGSPYPPSAPYNAPPQQYGPISPPSLGYDPNVRAQVDLTSDADALRKAMKGFGTDEKTLTRVLTRQDPITAVHLKETYNRRFGRNLENDIKSETSGWFETGLVALTRGPLMNDVHTLHDAIHGPGTNEELLNDVLLGRSNADLRAIKEAYRRAFNRSLDSDVKGELSLKTERHFAMVLAANRAEEPAIPSEIDRDVLELYKATEGKVGTDELLVCSIISSRSDSQLRAISQAYEMRFRVKLDKVIQREFSGHMEQALLFQLQGATNRPLRDAVLLENAMAGLGTKDRLLITRLVRYHWDRNYMGMVRQAYQHHFRRDLGSRVKGETSGHYEDLCLALING